MNLSSTIIVFVALIANQAQPSGQQERDKPYPVKKSMVEVLGPAPERDANDLFLRVSKSRAVLVGRVVERKPVAAAGSSGRVDAAVGGIVYKIQVVQRLCDQSKVAPRSIPNSLHFDNGVVFMFVPFDEPPLIENHYAEKLQLNEMYLLFLAEPDRRQQERWVEEFKLDKNREYFRGEERERGVVPLSDSQRNSAAGSPEVLSKITALCGAMAPNDVNEKIANLEGLRRSGDPILAREAANAITALSSNQH